MTSSIEHLVGHRFPGGVRTIEHWENFLLTEATGRLPMEGDLAHPVHLFHVPIDAAGIGIGWLFDLCQADGPDRVGLDSYDWEWFEPLRESVAYRGSGEILEVERRERDGRPYDHVVFRLDLHDGDSLVASTTTTWHFWRAAASTVSA